MTTKTHPSSTPGFPTLDPKQRVNHLQCRLLRLSAERVLCIWRRLPGQNAPLEVVVSVSVTVRYRVQR